MLIEIPTVWIIVLNVVGWAMLQTSLAWAFTRMPASWFIPRPPAGWEENGKLYERLLAVKQWKDRLPDGARWFGGGFPKARLRSRDADYLRRFAAETWRGELCHWTALLLTPLFFLWNPLWADLVIVAYALAANLPCVIVQRYNRARLHALPVYRRRNAPPK